MNDSSDTHVPHALIIAAFLAIFLAQVGINFMQVLRRGRRQRRQAMELQFPQPLPPQNRARNRVLELNAREEQALRNEEEGT